MDQRQMITQRAREFFPDGFENLLTAVRQDREMLRGWEEPAHLRSTLRRRTVSATPGQEEAGDVAVLAATLARRSGELEPAQQREALGETLEAAVEAIKKLVANEVDTFTPEETSALAALLILYARPALCFEEGESNDIPIPWSALLEDQREGIESNQRAVGRIEMLGHPEFDWAGTGVLVGDNQLITTRHIVELFAEQDGGQWQFRPGITAWLDFQAATQHPPSTSCRVQRILGVHAHYDLAVLEVETPSSAGNGIPAPLPLAAEAPQQLRGRQVYMAGYPIRDSRRNETEMLARMFREVYGAKRIQPGMLRDLSQFNEIQLLYHDCGLIGRSGGSCIIDLETQQVLGLHTSGRYLGRGTAIPLWTLCDDPLLRDCGVTFCRNAPQEAVDTVKRQLEMLAHTRFWDQAQSAIARLHDEAFGA